MTDSPFGPLPIRVQSMTAYMPVTQEMVDDALPPFDVIMQRMEENARAFAALPPEEQERIKAEKAAAYEAERCAECGCHPDEHAS